MAIPVQPYKEDDVFARVYTEKDILMLHLWNDGKFKGKHLVDTAGRYVAEVNGAMCIKKLRYQINDSSSSMYGWPDIKVSEEDEQTVHIFFGEYNDIGLLINRAESQYNKDQYEKKIDRKMERINLKMALFKDQKEEIKRVEKLIQENHLELNATDKIEDISVGGRQRVEILKMLYRNVDILILDEPTAVLTPQEVDELIATLKNLKEQGKTIIVITHKLREVMELADSITVIKQGKVVGNVLKKDTSERELAQMMVGRDVVLTVNNARKQQVESEIMYKAENLTTVNDYGKEVVSDMSFEVHKGEILGIAGVEGNGQSELVKLMTGLMESTRGTVFFDGKDITNWWPEKLRKAGIGIIPEDRYAQGLCREMTVSDNCIAGYHGEKDVCKRGLFNKKIINAKRDKYIKEFDIRLGDVNGNIGNLSGGNAQKVIIARELSANPKLLIACQPTRGVDIGSIEFIHKQILKFRDAGNTVILISSELSEIMSLSDRVIVMYKGKISGEVSPKEVSMAAMGLLMAGIGKEEQDHEKER